MRSGLTRIRNTFIECVDEDDGVPLDDDDRTQSDPIGANARIAQPRRVLRHDLATCRIAEDEIQASSLAELESDCDSDIDVEISRTESIVGTFKTSDDLMQYGAALPAIPDGEDYGHAPPAQHVLLPSVPVGFVWPYMAVLPVENAVPAENAEQNPPFGTRHKFHREVCQFGTTTEDFRCFRKNDQFEGRLSVVTESNIRKGGVHRYMVQLASGSLSRADGIGFVFSSRLPCTKDIQKIASVYLNQQGEVGMRFFSKTKKRKERTVPLQIADWIEMQIDLDKYVVRFGVWRPSTSGSYPSLHLVSSVQFAYGTQLSNLAHTSAMDVKPNVGHLACVIKNVGTMMVLGS